MGNTTRPVMTLFWGLSEEYSLPWALHSSGLSTARNHTNLPSRYGGTIRAAMDANAARELFSKFQRMLEDVWIEKQVCRNLVLDKELMTETELEQGLKNATRNPEYRRMAAEVFASSWKALAEFGADSALQDLASSPLPKDKQH